MTTRGPLVSVLVAIAIALTCFAARVRAEREPDRGVDIAVDDARSAIPAQGGSCGDYRCQPPEDCNTCPQDCGSCCGDRRCAPPEDCNICPQDCGRCCGDHRCAPPEDCNTCPDDCGRC